MLKGTAASGLGDRFEVIGEIGAGSFGRVLRARDRLYGNEVAVKVLATLEPGALVRFKRELRALAHVSHPNLVTLYELHASEGAWFYTMELVQGSTLDRWLAAAPRSEAEIRHALAQIASGLAALHDAGLLHRDLKPSNVLVAASGRVALADFGMVGAIDPARRPDDERAIGTVAYAAPETWTGRSASAAADWYSFGVTMFEALTGARPWGGPMPAQIAARIMNDGPRPSSVAPNVPRDLDELCAALLRKDPAARPGARECLAVLSGGSPPRVWISASASFVGREDALAELERALAQTRAGGSAIHVVQGPSGIGKSSLVDQFARSAHGQSALVLEGRCHPHDGLRARALDGIVDALARHLARFAGERPAEVPSEGAAALARMFPALRDVLPHPGADAAIPGKQQREAALSCLAFLLAAIARRRPLVLVVDDLQWADDESGAALGALVRAMEEGPGALVLATVREEHASSSPALRALRAAVPGVRTLRLDALGEAAARRLVETILGVADPERVAAIVAAAKGNPYLLSELAAALRGRELALRGHADPDALVDEVVQARAAAVPPSARRMLEVLALAEQPLDPAIAIEAAGAEGGEYLRDLSALRAGRLVSPRLSDGRQTIEPYHARVREAIVRALAPPRCRDIHLALARTLERSGAGSRDAIARHYLEGGDRARAYEHARAAAREARAALAFGACASMLRLAQRTGVAGPEEARALEAELADALANTGRGREAAEAFLALAASDRERGALHERRAAEQLLFSGDIQDGVEVLGRVLARVGLSQPRSRLLAVARVLWAYRFGAVRRLLRGGLAQRPRDPSLDARIDASHAATLGLTMTDPLASAYMQVQHLEDAIAAGDPARLVRALCIQMVHTAGGTYAPEDTRKLQRIVHGLAAREGSSEIAAYVATADAAVAWMESRLAEALRTAERAGEMLRSAGCIGMQWHIDTHRVMELEILETMGAWDAIVPRLTVYQSDAEERGDRYLDAALRARVRPTVALAGDRVARARAEIETARRIWARAEFDLTALYAAVRSSWCDLYEGDVERARATLDAAWRDMQRSLLVRVAFHREMAQAARGVVLLSWARAARGRDAARAEGRRIARELVASQRPLSVAYGTMLEAAAIEGAPDPGRYLEAARAFDAIGASMLAVACRWRAARASGGGGEAEARAAPARLVRPDRVLAMLSPG